MPFQRSLSAGFGIALVCLLALAPRPVLASFGGPSHGPYFDAQDTYGAQMAPEQLARIVAAQQNIDTLRIPIQQQIGALRHQIAERLSGSDAVDAGGLAALEQQIFVLRRQSDALDLEVALQIRAVLTAEQLAQAAQRHEALAGVQEQRERLLNPSQDPKSAYLPGDLFNDRLGYTRGVALADDQQQRMKGIMDSDAGAFRSIQQQRHLNRVQTVRLLMGDAPVTQVELAPLLAQAAALKEQIDDLRLTMTIQIRALLTPNQLAMAAELHQQLVTLRAEERAANGSALTAN